MRLRGEVKVHEELEKELERIKEIQNGAKKLFLHFEDPGRSLGFPLNHPVVRGASKLIEGYRKLLHFDEPQNETNDRRVAEISAKELDSLLNLFDELLIRYDNEIKASLELLEDRRTLWEGEKNTALEIAFPAAAALVGMVLYLFLFRRFF